MARTARSEAGTTEVTKKPAGAAGGMQASAAGAADLLTTAVRLAGGFTPPGFEFYPGATHVFAPNDYTVHEIRDPDHVPGHVCETLVFDDAASLNDYARRFAEPGALLFADLSNDSVTARLDWHLDCATSKRAGGDGERATRTRNAHAARLQLTPSEEWRRWNEAEADWFSQEDFARFLEENACDVIEPASASLIEIARDLEVHSDHKFRSRTDLQSGNRIFHYETEDNVKGQIRVPQTITVRIPFWLGEPVQDLEALFRYRASEKGLRLGFEWRRVEHRRQAAFRETAVKIAEETGLAVCFGGPRPT